VDALDNTKNLACAALVGCVKIGQVIHTTDVYIWEPGGADVDMNDIMRQIIDLKNDGLLAEPLYYDPYQCVKLAQDLEALGVQCQEFPQGQARMISDTFLYKLYKEGTIVNYSNPDLKAHVCGAAAKSVGGDKEEYRIVKPQEANASEQEDAGGQKLVYTDAAVAQSMAAYMAYHAPVDGGWAGVGEMEGVTVEEGMDLPDDSWAGVL